MGTSTDYSGGTGGAWTPYKRAVTSFARHGSGKSGERVQRVLARYVAARGGATALSRSSAAAAATGAGQGIGGLARSIATDGLTPTLERLGLGDLVNKDRWELLDGLIEALGGDGGTLEDKSVLSAVIAALDALFPEDAETYDDLAAVALDTDGVRHLVEVFVAEWAYYEMAPTLAEKLTHIEDRIAAQNRDEELRQMISDVVRIEGGDRDPLEIDWAGQEGHTLVETVIADMYSLIEEEMET